MQGVIDVLDGVMIHRVARNTQYHIRHYPAQYNTVLFEERQHPIVRESPAAVIRVFLQ